jgi:hypothetical protein
VVSQDLGRLVNGPVNFVRGVTLAALSRRVGSIWPVPLAAAINGLLPAAHLTAGQLVKVSVAEPF